MCVEQLTFYLYYVNWYDKIAMRIQGHKRCTTPKGGNLMGQGW